VLLRVLAVVALVAALAGALLHACALMARARLHRAAEHRATVAFDAELAQARAAIAAAVARGQDPRALAIALPDGIDAVPFDDDARNLQGNDAVAEGRYEVRIRTSTRDRYALFRTFRAPPYAMLAGIRDATTGTATGDDAGAIPTRIEVRYVNAATGATSSGDAWTQRAIANAGAASPRWDP